MENKNYVNRIRYIDKLKQFIDKPVIKVLTGMRRVGKSTLLTIIKDKILSHIPEENKIYLRKRIKLRRNKFEKWGIYRYQ